jgi:phage shock protein PspC (stress-responsive transcriptional regulator)
MRRVITLSLNGNAFALEDDAAEALTTYLEIARRALEQNADREEILSDLEQAIAEKSQRFLGSHKTVLSRSEIEQVLTEMGPVHDDGVDQSSAKSDPQHEAPSARRQKLYRIRQGQQLTGVCNGLAAYFGLDVTWMRLAFLLFSVVWGIAIPLYIVLIVILPVADTPEEIAAAYGEPFNAREYVERAKREAANLANRDWTREKTELKAEWQRSTSVVRREIRHSWLRWRQRRLEARRRRRAAASTSAGPATSSAGERYAPAATPGALQQLLIVIFTLPLVALFGGLAIVWIVAMFALVTSGTLFGLILPIALPVWLTIVLLLFIFWLITWPIRLLLHVISPTRHPASMHPAFSFMESLVGIAAFIAITIWAYHHVPSVSELIDHILAGLHLLIDRIREHVEVTLDA